MHPEDYPPPLAEFEPAPEPETEAVELPPDDNAFPLFERFAELCARRNQLKAELEDIEEKMERLQAPLRTFFASHPEFEDIRSHGFTIFVKRELWVRPKATSSRQEVCDALRTGGLGHYVHDDFSTSGLSSHVRQLEKRHASEIQAGTIADVSALLPAVLAQVLNVNPKYSVQGRRTKERKD